MNAVFFGILTILSLFIFMNLGKIKASKKQMDRDDRINWVANAGQMFSRIETDQKLLKAVLKRLMIVLRSKFFFVIVLATLSNLSFSQIDQSKGSFEDKFRQLDEVFPSPNLNRPPTGEPGPSYWQQRADYKNKN
jgi:type III secretory pathway component EscU